MAQQLTSLIKFRRGLKAQRLTTKFQEGEPVFETDTYRFFLGVGENGTPAATGGTISGNLTFIGPVTSNPDINSEPRAYEGDIMFANSKLWRMSSTGWTDIAPRVDNTTIIYNSSNQLAVKPGSFSVTEGPGITVTANTTVGIRNTPTNVLQIVGNELTLPLDSLTGDYVKQSFFNGAQFNLTGTTWNLNLNTNYFNTGVNVEIKGVPAGQKTDIMVTPNIGTVNAIVNERFADNNFTQTGINLNPVTKNIQINSELSVYDNQTNKIVGLKPGFSNTLDCSDDITLFNGTILDTKQVWPGKALTVLNVYTNFTGTPAIDELHKTQLTSAGFAVFTKGISGRGKSYKKYALPLFALPDEPQAMYFSNTTGNTFIRGTNLLAGELYYIEDNTKTTISLSSISTDTTTGVNSLNWDGVISMPVQAILYVDTISGTSIVDMTNPPAIFSAEVTSSGCNINGYNFGNVAGNIQVAYDLIASEGTFVPMTGVTVVNGPVNSQTITASKTGMPPASDIKGFQVTVTGKTPVYFEIN